MNGADVSRLETLSDEQVEIVGPRGQGVVPRRALGEWLARSGFRSRELRWFCGGDGRVVVEHVGEWHDIATESCRAGASSARRSLFGTASSHDMSDTIRAC